MFKQLNCSLQLCRLFKGSVHLLDLAVSDVQPKLLILEGGEMLSKALHF